MVYNQKIAQNMRTSMIRRKKPYENQLERVKRWKNRIENSINDYRQGKLTLPPLEFTDTIWSFFVSCDHMKDYIHNDATIKTKQSPYNHLDNTECLKICRDISVGVKHLIIKDPKTTGGPFLINLTAKRDDTTGKMLFDINIKSQTVREDFLRLANECILAWEDFIQREIASQPKKQIKKICPICKVEVKIDDDLMAFDCPNCKTENVLV
jgi:hypothetical protein